MLQDVREIQQDGTEITPTFWDMIDEAGSGEMELPEDWYELSQEYDREKSKRERREKRMSDCGSWSYFFDAHTGGPRSFMFKCKYFRDCPHCAAERAYKESNAIMDVAQKKRLVALELPSEEATKLIRGADKSQYVRYPQGDGNDLLLIENTLTNEGKEIDIHWLQKQDWGEIVNTPVGRNKSGKLHLPKTPAPADDFVIVTAQQFISDAPKPVNNQFMKRVIQETSDMRPKTVDELEDALAIRLKKTCSYLKQAGYSINVYQKKQKVTLSRLNWETKRKTKRIYTENPTRESVGLQAQTVPI